MRHVQVIVEGTVQGVGFRYFTLSTAVDHHITGWVKNLDNGTVEIEAQGDHSEMEQFLAKIKRGPTIFARVKQIHVTEKEPTNLYKAFDIIY
ncbi:acylphosphatase [Gracilibacillus sp. S3-1-1]|uniref:Acylphosphatase n=1 Tax=Gracilibacillus pellucidus TaxID=3095368 RepID=A0ACC6M5M5_9BACI|nr:acylphosphatase [Gracilibacillus sp. S3-1-1]MDX8046188.1 acylphosphatase [Gracilibacillus sp. S3-1-1]